MAKANKKKNPTQPQSSRLKVKSSANQGFFSRWKYQIVYAIENVLQDFKHNRLAALITILVMSVSISLPFIGYLLWKNGTNFAAQWDPTPKLSIYLEKSLPQSEIDQLQIQIKKNPAVDKIVYYSETQSLEDFKKWSGYDNAIELLDVNPLPAVLDVYPVAEARDNQQLKKMNESFINLPGIDQIKWDDTWFTQLIALMWMIKWIILGISILMILAVTLLVVNTIRLLIYARRHTIVVMQLMGATERFILRPFLYNAFFIGLLSGLLVLGLSSIFIWYVGGMIGAVSEMFKSQFVFASITVYESLFIVFVSAMVAWFSAYFAAKRYLHKMIFF